MRVVVNVAGKGYWLWHFPGSDADLRAAWADGRAPMHLLDGVDRAHDGELERVLRTPGDVDAIVDIDEGDAILYVGDDAIRWSTREVSSSEAVAVEEPELVVAIAGHTWTFPGTADELDVELDEGRFPAHLGPGWRGRPARFVGRVDEGEPADPDATVELLGPDAARFVVGGVPRDWRGLVERVEEEVTLAQLAARAPFEVEVFRRKVVGLTATADSDVDALELLLAHPESSGLVTIDLAAMAGPRDRVLAAIVGRPRPELVTLRLPWDPSADEDARIAQVAPRRRS